MRGACLSVALVLFATSAAAQPSVRERASIDLAAEWVLAGDRRPTGFGLTGGAGLVGGGRVSLVRGVVSLGPELSARVIGLSDPRDRSFGWGVRAGGFVSFTAVGRSDFGAELRGSAGYHYTWLPLDNATGVLVRFHTTGFAWHTTGAIVWGRARAGVSGGCAHVSTFAWSGCVLALSVFAGGRF